MHIVPGLEKQDARTAAPRKAGGKAWTRKRIHAQLPPTPTELMSGRAVPANASAWKGETDRMMEESNIARQRCER